MCCKKNALALIIKSAAYLGSIYNTSLCTHTEQGFVYRHSGKSAELQAIYLLL